MSGFFRSNLVRALLVLLLGIVFLDGMSVFIKTLLPRYSALELSAYRNVIGMIPAILLMMWSGELRTNPRKLMIPQWKLAFGRGLMVTAAQLFWYVALGKTEFALVAALGYTMSLFVVILSVPLLGERVGIWRSIAVVMGFVGAVWIVRPTADSFNLMALLPLGAALFYALSMVTVRLVDRSVSNALLYLYSAISAAVVNVIVVLATTGFDGIENLHDGIQITVMSLLGGCGVICMLISVRMAEPSLLAPFNYFGLISAFTMGWLVFGEAPFDKIFPGVLFIIGGGLLVLWRENPGKRVALQK
ncbi:MULTISPECIES: DMT family transporter [Rhodobacterales]|uniref:DMT family transporter n=1 Tax=Roseobacter sp. N2S TaxID=2663844 RepID=UPI002856A277|nr:MULTISPECIES: DMT family transporter [Rhodobacterales]MDR6263829.1 drug/metabolite transporter (DMT)-like permease [Roseobacter sp. N2S]